MTVVTRVALLCAVFLCGLEERAQTQRARCDRTSCFVLHREPQDFAGAQRLCKGSALLALSLREAKMTLPDLMRGSGGRYWLELLSDSTGSPMEEAAAGLQRCYTVSASGPDSVTVSQGQCRDKQDGFLCYFKLEEPCTRPLTTADMRVIIKTEHIGLELMEFNFFPQGTIAVVAKFDAKYPETKHVCFSGQWLQAPWVCEVLQGGCDHSCSITTHTCTCPAGQTLHANNISCTIPSKPQEGVSNASVCARGYALAQDGKSCVDVDECKDADLCIREGEECLNTDGGYECTCKDGFDKEDGECVDFSICDKCEHMLCEKSNGVYACECRMGYKVSPQDPTKCLRICEEEECLAQCIYVENEGKKTMDCFCPRGYIKDTRNETVFCTDINECETGDCDHKCENFFGGYRCWCNEGFELHGKGRCVRVKDKEEKEDKEEEDKEDKEEEEKEDKEDKEEGEYGSGSPPPRPTPASSHPAALPPYIKTGSVLGITVFLVLCAALLCLVVRNMVRRCGSFELPSFRPPDIDVFYLQQVTTETYKRLSLDKQFKNDLPRL